MFVVLCMLLALAERGYDPILQEEIHQAVYNYADGIGTPL